MNKFNFFKVFLAIMLFAISGCGDDENQPTNITVENKDALNQTVYANEMPATVSFVTKGAWTSSISEGATKSTVSWLGISPDSGDEAGSYTITISIAPNDTGSDRSAIITITSDGTTISVTVSQKATKRDGTLYDPDIAVTNGAALAQTIYANEKPEALSIVTKGAWTSTKTESWLSLSPAQGAAAGSYTVTFNLAPNATGNDRSASITITCGETSITANITQKATNRDGTPYEPDKQGPAQKGDVYVVGYEENAQGYPVAKIWKNGVAQDLSNASYVAAARSVFVSNGNVYVAGEYLNMQDGTYSNLWKNGVAQNLGDFMGYSVYVSGSDVYVAGNDGNVAIVSKNGVVQNLTEGYFKEKEREGACSVFVSGSDVYVAGYDIYYPTFGPIVRTYVATVWKNGVAQNLTDDTTYSRAQSVFVSGGDVYVAGYERDSGKLWKNGIVIGSYLGEMANSVYVSGSDVYVAGYERDVQNRCSAIVWKNGIRQKLTDGIRSISYSGIPGASAESVFVSGSDVYVAGYESNGSRYVAKLWKNGEAQDLTDGKRRSHAYSVFVVE